MSSHIRVLFPIELRYSAPMVLVQLFFDRAAAMQQFWGFYITVVLGLLAFFGSAARTRVNAAVMTLGFIGFAWVNLDGLRDAAQQRVEVCTALAHGDCVRHAVFSATVLIRLATPPLNITLTAPTVGSVVWFHRAADALTIAAIWYLVLRAHRVSRPVHSLQIEPSIGD
jgi:hypothetical protein